MADYTLRKIVDSDEPWRPAYDVFVDGVNVGHVYGAPLHYGKDIFGNFTWVARKFEWYAAITRPDYRALRPSRAPGFTGAGLVDRNAFRTRRDALDALVAEYRKSWQERFNPQEGNLMSAQDRHDVIATITDARAQLLFASKEVQRVYDKFYSTDQRNEWSGGRTGPKRELTVEEWDAVDRRLEHALEIVAQARHRVRNARARAENRERAAEANA